MDELVQSGLKHHHAGRLIEAEALYLRALSKDSKNPEALHFMGIMLHQRGDYQPALEKLRESIQLLPQSLLFHENLAGIYDSLGMLTEAASIYQAALAIEPRNARLAIKLGILHGRLQQHDEAERFFKLALEIEPQSADAHANLGVLLAKQGNHLNAIREFQISLSGNESSIVFVNLGLSLKAVGKLAEAVAAYDQSILSAPEFAQAHEYRGVALEAMQRYADAAEAHRKSLELQPQSATAWNNLGVALQKKGDVSAALDAFNSALRFAPGFAEAHNNIGTALVDAGRLDEAISSYKHAVDFAPDNAEFERNLAIAELMSGDFDEGWRRYECRFRCPEWAKRQSLLRKPRWNGFNADHQTVLVFAEQGFGDTIQFARYLPLVGEKTGKLAIECQKELEQLFRSTFPRAIVVVQGDRLPHFDAQIAMLSLPLVFGTTPQTIPHHFPYFFPAPDRVDFWKNQLAKKTAGMKIGIAWSGSHKDPHRNLTLRQMLEMGDFDNASLVSLQVGPAAGEIQGIQRSVKILDLRDRLDDFAETAAVIANLDLILSIDTAVAHLAGALGKSVWVFLRHMPDWRWGLAGDSTPWYPRMRLFRQNSPDDWQSAIACAKAEFDHLLVK